MSYEVTFGHFIYMCARARACKGHIFDISYIKCHIKWQSVSKSVTQNDQSWNSIWVQMSRNVCKSPMCAKLVSTILCTNVTKCDETSRNLHELYRKCAIRYLCPNVISYVKCAQKCPNYIGWHEFTYECKLHKCHI